MAFSVFTSEYCWQCKEDVEQDDLMILSEEGIVYAKLCFDCYESKEGKDSKRKRL